LEALTVVSKYFAISKGGDNASIVEEIEAVGHVTESALVLLVAHKASDAAL
jgi:hypothetical protein